MKFITIRINHNPNLTRCQVRASDEKRKNRGLRRGFCNKKRGEEKMKKMIGSKFIETVRDSDWDGSLDLYGLIITGKY